MGKQWAANEARTERTLTPVTEALLKAAVPQPGEHVLDIGCGCGGSTLAFARAVGDSGYVLGADVAAPMIEVATATALKQTTFMLADAASHAFPPAAFDLLASRFGVMFFGDPDAAFANLRKALKPTGRVAFACWRPLAENPWVAVPLAALRPLAPPLPRPGPEDPGPFAFGDPARVTRILTGAGFAPPRFAQFDIHMRFAGDPATAAVAVSQIGPASRVMRELPEEQRPAALAALAAAITPYAADGGVALPASGWLVTTTPV